VRQACRNIDTGLEKRVLPDIGCLAPIFLSHLEVVESESVRFLCVFSNDIHYSVCNFILTKRADCIAIDSVCIMTFNIASNDLNLDRDVKKHT
jgi:hypothetical protein